MVRFVLLLAILIAPASLWGQRPWILQSTTSAGPNGKIAVLGTSVYLYDTVALRSYDHGATWESVPSLVGTVCAMSEFTLGLSLAVTRDDASGLVRCYFSSGGGPWTQFDSLSGIARPVRIASIGETWYMATAGPKIYVFEESIDSVTLPSTGATTDLVARGTDLVASTANGVFLSTDAGRTWTRVGQDVVGLLYVRGEDVFATATQGVKRIDLGTRTITDHGAWVMPTVAPASLDIDAYQGRLYTITRGTTYQAYMCEGDTAWKEIAYPLPGTTATLTSSVFGIDAGFMVLNHRITEGFTDSAGVYAYDLNDFTSVDDVRASSSNGLRVAMTDNELIIRSEDDRSATITVVDMLGAVHATLSVPSALHVQVPGSVLPRGFIGVIVRHADGTTRRGHTLR